MKKNVRVLKDITINFYKNEFTSILGTSGSGKTTLLNIIGGLDKYDAGDLLINGVSTHDYTDRDYDAYRNYMVGFVFQSYNLIMYQTVLENVCLALTLSGISKSERKKRALKALEKVGLSKHVNKLPTELSGGQMQRVAIARALVNDPQIILADEPTGALDSKTSKEVMDLLKEVAKDKIVIMVTHNEELAKEYSDRIIKMQDGAIISDDGVGKSSSKTIKDEKLKKTKMSFLTSLHLSLHNLMTKKGRTFLTAFAGSIGIIGIALILSISNGMNIYIKNMERDSMKDYPITLENNVINYDEMLNFSVNTIDCVADICSTTTTTTKEEDISSVTKKNDLSSFKKYLDEHNEINDDILEIDYLYDLDLQVYKNTDNGISKVNTSDHNFKELLSNEDLIKSKYDLVTGALPVNKNEIVLVLPSDRMVTNSFLYSLNLKNKDELEGQYQYAYDDFIGLSYKLVLNTDYYKLENGYYKDFRNDKKYLNSIVSNGLELKIVGILVNTDDSVSSAYIGYTKDLSDYVIDGISKSNIYQKQMSDKTKNVLTGITFDEYNNTYEEIVQKLGLVSRDEPNEIDIYAKDYDSKNNIIAFLNKYNKEMEESDNKDKVITYTDLIKTMLESITKIINVVSLVLVGLVGISLVVSSIMIAIITYISVLERTKEIGILRALGASKKDIKRVFVAETIIEGFLAGLLGILSSLVFIVIINLVVGNLSNISTIAVLSFNAMLFLIILSIMLNCLAGLIPASMASRKNPVEALRSE